MEEQSSLFPGLGVVPVLIISVSPRALISLVSLITFVRKELKFKSFQNQMILHHPLDVNTLKGHGDSVTALCFSSDGRNLPTACADGIVRIFKLDDALSKSFKFLRINLPAGGQPTAVAFSDGASPVVVSSQNLSGSSLYMYGDSVKEV
ncbi:hypothetical protein MKX03_006558 [Papaver bracteatum]|nr:hypothetical protein MKX03_006558 [Papaver bracteatum]